MPDRICLEIDWDTAERITIDTILDMKSTHLMFEGTVEFDPDLMEAFSKVLEYMTP